MEGGTIENKVVNPYIEMVLDGTENWNYYSGTNTEGTFYRYYIPITNAIQDEGYCNYFIRGNFDNRGSAGNNFKFFVGGGYINFRYDSITSLQNWENYVAQQYANGTPVIVQYKLAEPDETNFTSEQQAVYNEIISEGTYNPVTHYSTNAVVNPDIDMSYYRDLPTIINNLEN